MIIKFDEMQVKELPAFYGGDGALLAHMFSDEKNKILLSMADFLQKNCEKL